MACTAHQGVFFFFFAGKNYLTAIFFFLSFFHLKHCFVKNDYYNCRIMTVSKSPVLRWILYIVGYVLIKNGGSDLLGIPS